MVPFLRYSASKTSVTLKSGLEVTSSSRMRVINHNWSATKQRPHPQSVAEISRHSVLSGDRIRQCETSDMYNRLERIPACDRKTDGQTDILPRHSPRYAHPSRGNEHEIEN